MDVMSLSLLRQPAKLRVWRAYMLACFKCLRAWHACVLTCFCALRANVLASLAYLHAYVLGVLPFLACLQVLVFGVLTWYVMPHLACLLVFCPSAHIYFTCLLCSNILRAYVIACFFDVVCPIFFTLEKLNCEISFYSEKSF